MVGAAAFLHKQQKSDEVRDQPNLYGSQDKGQNNCVQEFVDAISENQPSPIPFEEIIEVSRVAIEIADSI